MRMEKSEQYHSEIKTDMDVERLPSGKFESNKLALELTVIAYNILRIIGQEYLKNGMIWNGRKYACRFRGIVSQIVNFKLYNFHCHLDKSFHPYYYTLRIKLFDFQTIWQSNNFDRKSVNYQGKL